LRNSFLVATIADLGEVDFPMAQKVKSSKVVEPKKMLLIQGELTKEIYFHQHRCENIEGHASGCGQNQMYNTSCALFRIASLKTTSNENRCLQAMEQLPCHLVRSFCHGLWWRRAQGGRWNVTAFGFHTTCSQRPIRNRLVDPRILFTRKFASARSSWRFWRG
jgi:hypothetical protein